MTRTVRVRVSGQVQGVGYRAWCQREAEGRGLSGWVRNRQDGSVEALLSGETSAIEAMIAHLREGPPAARVERVDAAEASEDVPPIMEVRETV